MNNSLPLSCPSIDYHAAQRIPSCRCIWLLSRKAEAETRSLTVQTDLCRLDVAGVLHCWCRCTRFAFATSICCCLNIVCSLSQTTHHSSQSPANSSSLVNGILHLPKDDLMWSIKLFFAPHRAPVKDQR